ncbi:efflux RND transporter periplasmic adaptor subunit [Corallococcus praedator]|uniref:Efflux RND transporter periplasmic adaptor subunit n=1 Tax=Corallococcus praedator TaxID=2316724 RepID=A0ABX9Q894_9BACT|nr:MULTISPECIES: efflux RND transporter periplasmic adaptor subunit [Corallococcus]RKH21023.1 efflux RND transporter periplasmic adaptor subunit [Corallococcus sp. CA031C]RKH93007.1 efflux RND transporter periplasmic adaptor subunit [Corallococcus praedator]
MKSSTKPFASRAFAAVGVAAALSLTACDKADAAAAPPAAADKAATAKAPTAVKVVTPRGEQASASEEVTGTLFPAQGLQVGFEVGGRLESVRAQKGQAVKKGDVLAQLNPEIVDAQVAGAEAAVAAAEAGASMAKDAAERSEKLSAGGGISEQQHRSASSTAAQAQAQVLAAKAQLAQARAARRRHDLKAPFTGTLIESPDQTGATVAPGTPLFTLEQLDTLVFRTTVPESSRALLKPGVKVRVVSLGGGAATDEAVVRTILPSADPNTRRVPVEIAVPNADGRFVAHTLARAMLKLGELRDAQVIPLTAVSSSNGDHVLVVDDGALRRVDVQVLERRDREVVVLAASVLQQVVDYPTPALTPGTRVSVK